MASGISTATRTPPTKHPFPAFANRAMKEYENYPLLPHNTFGIAARARRFLEFPDSGELQAFLGNKPMADEKHLVIGGGSNLLFLRDYDGTLLHSAIRGIETEAEDERRVFLKVGSGEIWDELVAYCVGKGWSGIENLSLIPGEVGAAAVQNIGAYGTEVCDCITRVDAVSLADGSPRTFSREECAYSYRDSIFKQAERGKYFVTYVHLVLEKGGAPRLDYRGLSGLLPHGAASTLAEVRDAVIALRREKLPDPEEWGNAGSFFMNPIVPDELYLSLKQQSPGLPSYKAGAAHTKIPAAWLIEQCGWKGRALGNAAVWERQPLVLINRGHASASEITELAGRIVADVQAKFGITLHPEVNYIS